MPLTSLPLHNKVVGLFNNKLETHLVGKKYIKSLKTFSEPHFLIKEWDGDIINSFEHLQNVSFAPINIKGHFYLNLLLRALLLSSLVGVREISAQEHNNTALRHRFNDSNALGNDNRVVNCHIPEDSMVVF